MIVTIPYRPPANKTWRERSWWSEHRVPPPAARRAQAPQTRATGRGPADSVAQEKRYHVPPWLDFFSANIHTKWKGVQTLTTNTIDLRQKNTFDRLIKNMERTTITLEAYHSHKELLVHAVITLEVTLLAFLIFASDLMPDWLCKFFVQTEGVGWTQYPVVLYFIAFLFLLFRAHKYVMIQLRHRRASAIWLSAMHGAFWRWVQTPPAIIDTTERDLEEDTVPARRLIDRIMRWRIMRWLDRNVFPILDRAPDILKPPICLHKFFKPVKKGPEPPEKILAATSLLVFGARLRTH